MFKPLTRSAKNSPRANGGFAETQFLHTAGEDDYSGFAPTQMFGEDDLVPLVDPAPPATPAATRAAASAEDTAASQARATAQWTAAQEAQAHDAAHQARAVIAAQRQAGDPPADGTPSGEAAAPRSGLARLRAAFERLLPGGLLPLFVGVSATMAMISAVLPMIDKF